MAEILPVKPVQSQAKNEVCRKEGTLVEPGSIDFIIPDGAEEVGVQVAPTGGAAATVFATEDSIESVNAGTATFIEWDYGTVTVPTQGQCDGVVSAIRITQTNAGSVKYSVQSK